MKVLAPGMLVLALLAMVPALVGADDAAVGPVYTLTMEGMT